MHMKIVTDTPNQAIPLFGLNASSDALGVLMVTARTGSESVLVSVMPFTPQGQYQSDGRVLNPTDSDELSLVTTTLVAEGGFCFDGVWLSDVQYLTIGEFTGTVLIDVSFVPNCLPVRGAQL